MLHWFIIFEFKLWPRLATSRKTSHSLACFSQLLWWLEGFTHLVTSTAPRICIFWPRAESGTFLPRIGQLGSGRKNSYELFQSPNSKITNQRIIDFNILEQKCRQKFHFIRTSYDVSKTVQTRKLLIFVRFSFHDVQEQLKTSIDTNFRSEWVIGFVKDYAWISKLLRDAAFTWRPRELSCWLKKWLISENLVMWTVQVLQKVLF